MAADLQVTEVWVSEHYWPALAEELVSAQAQRLAADRAALTEGELAGARRGRGPAQQRDRRRAVPFAPRRSRRC